MSMSGDWWAGVGTPSYLTIRRDADFSGASATIYHNTPVAGWAKYVWGDCGWLCVMPDQRGGAEQLNAKNPEYGYLYGVKNADGTEVGFHFVDGSPRIEAPAYSESRALLYSTFFHDFTGSASTDIVVYRPETASIECSIWLYMPFIWYGRCAQVVASILRCRGVSTTYIDMDSFNDTDDEQAAMGSADDDEPFVFYRRQIGQSVAETIKQLARCSWNLLTINMAGKIAMMPRTSNAADYTIASLEADDGLISVQWGYAYEMLINDIWVSHRRYFDITDDVPTTLSATELPVPPRIRGLSGFPYANYTDATSVAKYGTLTGNIAETTVQDGKYERKIRAHHFQWLENHEVTPGGDDSAAMTTLMSRFGAVDSNLRRELTIVQDGRGLDYDAGWIIEDVAITDDGVTIDKVICTRKVIDFSDMTVTSVLLEEPA